MKTSKQFEALHKKPLPELQKELLARRSQLWELSGGLVAGKVKNVREIRQIRRSIAQIMTLITAQSKASASRAN